MAYVSLSVNVVITTPSKSLVLRAKNGCVARILKSVNVANVTIINPKVAGFESKEWLRSSEIKEDGLRFIERQRDDHQPQSCWFSEQRNGYVARKLKSVNVANVTIINPKVAGFESKEWLRSSEIKEDGLRFIERQRDDNSFKVAGFESKEWLRSSEIKEMAYVSLSINVAITPSKFLVLRAKNGYVARKLKKMAYVSLSVNVAITPSKLLVLRGKNSYLALKLKKMAYVSFSREKIKAILRCELIYKVINSCFRENLVQIYF